MNFFFKPSIFLKVVVCVVLLGAVNGCGRARPIEFAGATQGTTYHITVVSCSPQQTTAALQQQIERRLAQIDLALSNYRDDSELSHFNRKPAGDWIPLGTDLYAVLQVSQQISAQSAGAFDVSVAPLMDLWGFGRKRKDGFVPGDADIAAARALVDYRHIELDTAQPRARKQRALTIDINGIAQGYTVDQLANVLSAAGCGDYLVEVGGELRLAGHNAEQKLWRIGIEKPVDGLGGAQQALRATNVGVTTAGDYRDYFEKDGVRYSHTIDPRTGRPIAHKLASVTVVAANATLADGWDTVLEVLGPELGFEFAQKHNIAAFFIVREVGQFTTRSTAAMQQLLTQ